MKEPKPMKGSQMKTIFQVLHSARRLSLSGFCDNYMSKVYVITDENSWSNVSRHRFTSV